MAPATLIHPGSLMIPARLGPLSRFRRWARSDDFPEGEKISYLNGELWIDRSPEDLFLHNLVKGEFSRTLATLVKRSRTGLFFSDGALVSNPNGKLSTEPDGTFVLWSSFMTGRIKKVRGKRGFKELAGTPDLVLEIVSPSSVRKDTVVLLDLYWRAGIPEYWLVDARSRLGFEILRRTPEGYAKTKKRQGWVRSEVFGRSFRLTRKPNRLGDPEHTLHAR